MLATTELLEAPDRTSSAPVLCPQQNQSGLPNLPCKAPCLRPSGVALRPAPYREGVEVEVEDNGCGIKAEHVPHIFEPFFTAWSSTRGWVLGLSVSYGIIRDHGGSIAVDSTPGRGSLFRVRLPLQPPCQE